ncbi:hypothetical protein SCUCBS95973_003819 [Sporothrix curviconia]|uniref:F-box domain-containing protein n=1 Tax=Sporothrix curviconia TaxID=1260050 RepID=A0ABP0BII0_9PEZI
MADVRLGGDDTAAEDGNTGGGGGGAVAVASRPAARRFLSPPRAPVIDTQAVATNRKAYLLSLVPDLTLDEIWMLQERLAALDLRTDIFARLPPELQLIVSECLGPADLGCCLHVSSMWRGSFLHESMRKDLARRCFPSLLEYVDAVRTQMARSNQDHAGSDDNEDANRRDLSDHIDLIFAETARKYALRALGRFRCVFRHCLSPPLTVAQTITTTAGSATGEITPRESTWLDQGRPIAKRRRRRRKSLSQMPGWQPPQSYDMFTNRIESALELESDNEEEKEKEDPTPSFHGTEYAHGRLAWQCLNNNATWFLVDNLRDGRRIPLCVPNDHRRGESFLLVGFGDELLVAASSNRMLAWNFVTGEQQTKQLPAQMDTVQTHGKRICILAAGRVFVWTFGGMLQDADMAGLDEKHLEPDVDGRLPSFFILDPVNDGVFYLGNFELDVGQMGRNGVLGFHLHMFEDLRYKQTFSDYIHFDNYAFPLCLIEATVRRNARGLYSLASWRAGNGAPGPTRNVSTSEVKGVASLAFNIYTKTFSLSFFSLPPVSPAYGRENTQLIRIHIWNDQLITLVDRYRDAPQGKVRRAKPLLFAFDDEYSEAARCTAVRPFSAVPLYTSSLSDASSGGGENPYDETVLGGEDTHIKPEFRQKVRFDELSPDTPGQWLQDDDDWTKNKCLLRFALDIDTSPTRAEPYRPAHIGSYFMQGDDDFFVFRHGNEYTVWSFRDDIVRSVPPSGAVESSSPGEVSGSGVS